MKKYILAIPVAALAFCQPAAARDNILIGGLTFDYDYQDRKYDEEVAGEQEDGIVAPSVTGRDSQLTRNIRLTPYARLTSSSERDSLIFSYAPGFVYDQENSETDMDHALSLDAHRNFSKDWRLSISEKFIYSDDPYLSVDPQGEIPVGGLDVEGDADVASDDSLVLSDETGRRRYQTNTVAVNSDYTYGKDSDFGLGYIWNTLRNDDTGPGGYEDFDKHEGLASLSYRFNPAWKLGFTGRYVKGLFDPPGEQVVERVEEIVEELNHDSSIEFQAEELSNDLQEYHGDLLLSNNSLAQDPLSLGYSYIGTDYEQILRQDNQIHQMTLSWQHLFSPQMEIGIGGGPSVEKTDGQKENWDYNAHIDWNYKLQHSSFSFGVAHGFDQSNFNGTDERGVVDFVDVWADAVHNFTPDISTSLFASYRDEKRDDPAIAIARVLTDDQPIVDYSEDELEDLTEYTSKSYNVGGQVNYTFLRWFTAGLSYTFSHRDSERLHSDYDDHRVLLTLSVQKELLRW